MYKLILLSMCIVSALARGGRFEHGHGHGHGHGMNQGGFRPPPPMGNFNLITPLLQQIINLMQNRPGNNPGTTVAPGGSVTSDQLMQSLMQIISMLSNCGGSTTPFPSTGSTTVQSTTPLIQTTTPQIEITTPQIEITTV